MSRNSHLAVLFGALALLSGPSIAQDNEDHDDPYQMHEIEGSDLKRITLIERALARLGIETAAVSLTKADRTFVVGGRVVLDTGEPAQVATTDTPAAFGLVWVSFPITEEIEDSLSLTVLVRPLNGGAAGSGIPAMADTALNDGVTTELGGRLLYRLQGDGNALKADEVVLVEVPYAGNGIDHKTVPYAAIIYDQNGDEWVYVSPEAGVFERHAVDVAYIKGDLALLLEGPEVGSQVVTVGGSELLGIEYEVGH